MRRQVAMPLADLEKNHGPGGPTSTTEQLDYDD
jgi:hypothetical protein